MNWKTDYPTVANVKMASFDTLSQWDQKLPAPETDVEKTVRRKIKAQMMTIVGREARKTAPELADKWNDLHDKLESLGLGSIGRM